MSAESQVISAICHNKDIVTAINAPDIDELFNSHRDIWDKVKEYYYKHKGCPETELVQKWFHDFEPDSVNAPTSYYIEELRGYKLKNDLRKIAQGIAGALDAKEDPTAIINALQRHASTLTRFSSGIKDLNLIDSDRALKHYDHVAERVREMGGAVGIKTGFDSIDASYSTGQAPGHFICIIGWPGKKKTFFAGLLAINAWKQGFRPMIVSLEMTPENMRDRIYTLMGEGQWRMSGFNRGEFDRQDFENWSKETFDAKQEFIIVSSEGHAEMTPATIQAKIDQYKPDWILVDYLQLLTDNKKSGQDTARVMNISKELKLMAVRNNIPIVAILSATSTDKQERNHPPILANVAWSKAIEYDADMALAVHTYDNGEDSITEITNRKNRHGGPFDFYITLNPETGEVEEVFDAPDWLEENA